MTPPDKHFFAKIAKTSFCLHFVKQNADLPYKVSNLCFSIICVKHLFNVLFLQMKNALLLLFIFTKQNS